MYTYFFYYFFHINMCTYVGNCISTLFFFSRICVHIYRDVYGKRDVCMRQKRPIQVYGKRDVCMRQKRSTCIQKTITTAYRDGKRDLCMRQKRPTCTRVLV